MTIDSVGSLLRQAAFDFVEDNAGVFGAALAYYTFFSLAPLLVIAGDRRVGVRTGRRPGRSRRAARVFSRS